MAVSNISAVLSKLAFQNINSSLHAFHKLSQLHDQSILLIMRHAGKVNRRLHSPNIDVKNRLSGKTQF